MPHPPRPSTTPHLALAVLLLAGPVAGAQEPLTGGPVTATRVSAVVSPDGATPDGATPDGLRPPPADTAPAPRALPAPRARAVAFTAEAVRAPLSLPIAGGIGPHVLHVQVLLGGAGFSPGVLDGHWAANTRGAVRAFRASRGLSAGDTVDALVFELLRAASHGREPVAGYTLTAADLRGPFRQIPASSYAKARLDCLCYGSVEEKLAERFHTTPSVLRQLNPGVDLALATAGTAITVPNTWRLPPAAPLARLVVDKQHGGTTGYDGTGALLFWFPSSTGTERTPSPSGLLTVRSVTLDPWYRYNPAILGLAPGPVANLPPGPNSPVGTVWIQLSRAHIGIHGTPEPGRIGHEGSNGCVRLTNWDARFLAGLVQPGVEVDFR